MQETLLALSLLTITGLTGICARVLNLHIPMPLLQIAAGSTAAFAGLHVGLDNNLFLLLFIAPLLFVDAYRIPMREFGELRHIIAAMAIGLVLLSTLAGGYFLHWLLPSISLAAAFALAGALSPTDAISVSGILKGGRVPPRLLYLLGGEALLNDASGLVCFKFAVAAATTGLFSLKAASANFVWVAAGGVLTGVMIGLLSSKLESFLLHRGYDDPPSHALLALMIPFAVYLAAEYVETSGILAVVAGGMTIRLSGVMNETQIETRMRATAIWDMVSFTLNGLVFLLLGLQLPHLLHEAKRILHDSGDLSLWSVLLAILGLQAVMTIIRLFWVTGSASVRHVIAHIRHHPCVLPSWGEKLILALAGTRGTITLAAILTLPAAADFPQRDLLISLAAGVIISSLLLASLLLPLALRLLPSSPGQTSTPQQELDDTRLSLVNTALSVLKNEATRSQTDLAASTPSPELAHALPLLLQEFQELHDSLDSQQSTPATTRDLSVRNRRAEVAIRLRIIRAQRKTLRDLLHERNINDETERVLGRQLDVHEQELLNEAAALPHA